MSYAESFFSLAKTNNGYFKSSKQADFLLSKCQDDNTYISVSEMYGNSFMYHFICDSDGVMLIEKHLKNKIVVHWERSEDHEKWLKEKEIADQEMVKRKAQIAWINKARGIVLRHQADLNRRMVEKMSSFDFANDLERVKRVCSLYDSLKAKIARLEKLVDSIEFA